MNIKQLEKHKLLIFSIHVLKIKKSLIQYELLKNNESNLAQKAREKIETNIFMLNIELINKLMLIEKTIKLQKELLNGK